MLEWHGWDPEKLLMRVSLSSTLVILLPMKVPLVQSIPMRVILFGMNGILYYYPWRLAFPLELVGPVYCMPPSSQVLGSFQHRDFSKSLKNPSLPMIQHGCHYVQTITIYWNDYCFTLIDKQRNTSHINENEKRYWSSAKKM